VAAMLWLASRGYESVRRRADAARQRQALIRALFAEIDFNTRDLEIFVRESDLGAVRRRILEDADGTLVPHITDARHTEIYRA